MRTESEGPTSMDKSESLATNLHFWRFLHTRQTRIELYLVSPPPPPPPPPPSDLSTAPRTLSKTSTCKFYFTGQDTAYITIEHRLTNLLLLLFFSFFSPIVLHQLRFLHQEGAKFLPSFNIVLGAGGGGGGVNSNAMLL